LNQPAHPSFIQLYPTLRCNQDCLFCFNRSFAGSASHRDMNVRDAYALSSLLPGIGISEIDVLGGEPMLISWMEDFMRHVVDSGIALNISTNGSLPDALDRISEIPADLLNIGVSLHGSSRTHNFLTRADNFSKTVAGIKKIIAKGKAPIVKSVLTRDNMDEISGLIHYLADLGVKKYFLLHEDIIGTERIPSYFSHPEFREFYAKLREESTGIMDIGFVAASGFYKYGIRSPGRCDAGTKKIAVMPDGSVFPCNLFSGFKEFSLGNIFRDSADKIFTNPVLDYFRQYTGNSRCKLRGCEYYSGCTGGCPAHSYFFHGALDAVDPRCARAKNI
jgi:radical SAM protein with 4Fe4S-binding SPASM domain